MKKHYSKRKRVVIDELDGKIISDNHRVIKVDNIPEYVEKNGYKLLKVMSILILMTIFSNYSYAFNPETALNMDLSILTNVYLLIGIVAFSVFLMYVGFVSGNFYILVIGNILLFFTGLVLLTNGFNPIISIIVTIIPFIIIWSVK